MASDTNICNLALLRLGTRSTISSLTEGSTEANACAMIYPLVRDALLSQHRWSFATRRVTLADLGNPPDSWAFRYAYPTDCLQARQLAQPVPQAPPIAFEVSGDQDSAGNAIRVILTNQPQAELLYTAAITSPALFNPPFVEALSWMVAAELAVALTGDAGLAQSCLQAAAAAITSAKDQDADEGMVIHRREAEWIRGRDAGTEAQWR